MLFNILQTTLAFAPAAEDLDDIDFRAPVVTFRLPADEEESEPGEP
ncbi:MAG: hypothetical protein ACK40I_10495 [Tabrizicola sp.]